MSQIIETISEIRGLGTPVSENVKLANFTYLRTGGNAAAIAFPSSKEQFAKCIVVARRNDQPFKVVGNTSNLLFLDNVDYGLIISTRELTRVEVVGNELAAESGAQIPQIARAALQHSLGGMEGLEGIPGTLGGGIFMNAGAYGSELRDHLTSIEVVDLEGQFRTVSVKEANLGHRTSLFRQARPDSYVTAARFTLPHGNQREIYRRMELYHAKRHRYQEFMYPNLGSIFSGNIYRTMSMKDPIFGMINSLYSVLGYRLKILGRESPINRSWINTIAQKRFKFPFEVQPFSDKTINCLVNRGQGTDEMVRFINFLQGLAGAVPLENEIVDKF